MKILFFSATGNSLYIAKRLGGELLSIPRLQKNGVYEIAGNAVGIVCPVYGFTMPNLVKEYLEKAEIRAEYVFAIMTFGNEALGALTQMKKLLNKRGVHLRYANAIEMIDNYLPLFEIDAQLKKRKEQNIEEKINAIAQDIQARRHLLPKQSLFPRFISTLVSALWENKKAANKRDKQFLVNDSCNGCGICRAVCPAANIAGTGKPEYRHTCEFCLACIHLCPRNAIHVRAEKSAKRFINANIRLSEIINANTQKGGAN